MKIYTRTGDRGETGLFGGGRVPKDHARVQAYGAVDELNASLGRALTILESSESRGRLARVQHDLFSIGSHLASPRTPSGRRRPELPALPELRIGQMEEWMDEAEEKLPVLRAFILPGGSPGAAELHLCRTSCRRAERAVVALFREEASQGDPEGGLIIRYLNRFSDLLFVLARIENLEAGVAEVEWTQEEP